MKPPSRSVLNLEQISEEFKSLVVKIEGLDLENTEEETIRIIFSNEDQGGGEIESIEFQDECAYVIFKKPTGM